MYKNQKIDCLFCKIINKTINSKVIFENDNILVFEDINPKNDIHWLVVTKEHFVNLFDIDIQNMNYLFNDIKTFVLPLLKDNCQIIINNGDKIGQEVQHIHVHILSAN